MPATPTPSAVRLASLVTPTLFSPFSGACSMNWWGMGEKSAGLVVLAGLLVPMTGLQVVSWILEEPSAPRTAS
jgi:hypothetical protein